MLKGIIAKEDWRVIRQKIFYSFLKDTYYSEMKNLEVIQQRVGAVDRFINYAGKLVSWEWVRRNLLMQTDEEMKQLDAQMLKEKNDPRYQQLEAMSGGGGMMPGMGGAMGGMGGGMEGPEMGGPGGGEEGGEGPGGSQSSSVSQDGETATGGGGEPEQQQGGGEEQQGPQAQGPAVGPTPGAGDEEDEEKPVDLDDLPTERVTANVERLWRR